MTTNTARSSRASRLRRSVFTAAAAMPIAVIGVGGVGVAQAHETHSGSVAVRLDPAKGSDATGVATLTPTADGGLTVEITGRNMVPNMPHAQHIHGDLSGHEFVCPTDDADADGDGYITVEEGLPDY